MEPKLISKALAALYSSPDVLCNSTCERESMYLSIRPETGGSMMLGEMGGVGWGGVGWGGVGWGWLLSFVHVRVSIL